MLKSLAELKFDNRLVRELPGEQSPERGSRQTPGIFYVATPPTPVAMPEVLAWSDACAELLELDRSDLDAEILSGTRLLEKSQPHSTRYGGHQFGHWAGQLGDGRAISLGEVLTDQSARFEIQLKGAGPTPYSRRADGRAVLRSSVREFLCSEAMHYLGIPTTRALACVTTGESVTRDMFYDGNPANEAGAIVTRVAQSFLRFGHFEILASSGETELLRKLVSHTVGGHFPGFEASTPEGLTRWFEEVCDRTARMIAHWMRVGFVHGVMNTDNMSILGLTIDYGPYGWLDVYDPEWTPNTTDKENRRYRFGQQPAIALWNLTRLAEALSPLLPDPQILISGLERYQETFSTQYSLALANKLGLNSLRDESDEQLVRELDRVLRLTEVDPTLFYRKLSDSLLVHVDLPATGAQTSQENLDVLCHPILSKSLYSDTPDATATLALRTWIAQYHARMNEESRTRVEIAALMNRTTPCFLLRNYLVQEALDGLAQGDRSTLDALMRAMQTPYELNDATRPFFKRRPEWARSRAGCSALSCSS
jgi:uncharacterized protein YdiU (UPF0061 family)